MKGGGEGLYGRPRPVPLAPSLEEHDHNPTTGDHKGPPNPSSTALAPTESWTGALLQASDGQFIDRPYCHAAHTRKRSGERPRVSHQN